LYAGCKLLTVVAITCVIFAGTRALGGEPTSHSRMIKRQTIARSVVCMKKRMSDDRRTSFNEARKACNGQDNKESDGPLLASATPPKP
jgi:hypothetical protein